MKKQYNTPITDLIVINLQDSVLDGEGGGAIDWPGGSPVGTDWNTNKSSFDIEDDANDVLKSKSLWDE